MSQYGYGNSKGKVEVSSVSVLYPPKAGAYIWSLPTARTPSQ